MQHSHCHLIIEGIREDGDKFRPSDWIERLSSILAHFGPDNRLQYAGAVRPGTFKGQKCLVVDQGLKERDPAAYDFVVNFAQSNGLRMHADCDPDDVQGE